MLSRELTEWLRLSLTPEIGARRGKKLLERFKSPGAILEASWKDIAEVESVGGQVASKIIDGGKSIDLDRQIKLIERNNVTLIPLNSAAYPANLKSTYDPPLVLFVKGEILPQDYFSIAIVGTRLASFYGRAMAEKLSRQLAEKGFTIISGGARGIDTAGHQAALKVKGRTIAVLGCGVDIVYPPENEELFEQIAASGALVSEFPLLTRPDKKNFPMRNRIISGLSLGVVVAEAPRKSGALITVTCAADQGREVFSVPGHADSFASRGSNQLLREGAKLVEDADDIIEELAPVLKAKIGELRAIGSGSKPLTAYDNPGSGRDLSNAPLSGPEAKLYGLLSCGPLLLDDILARSQLSVSAVMAILTVLELKKLVRQLPGKVFKAISGREGHY